MAPFLSIPVLLILNKYVKTVCKYKIGIWSSLIRSLLFNDTFRIVIELYIDYTIITMLNLNNIKWGNLYEIIATAGLLIGVPATVMLPFFIIHLITKNRFSLSTDEFTSKWGIFVADLQLDSPFQYCYYPLFLFHRMTIALVIVFFY